jgi:hypothetical protein
MTTTAEAWLLSERHLAKLLPRRWRHVQAVGRRAEQVSALVDVDYEALAPGSMVTRYWVRPSGRRDWLPSLGPG